MKGRPWTLGEIRAVRECPPKQLRELAAKMGRTVNACSCKRWELRHALREVVRASEELGLYEEAKRDG